MIEENVKRLLAALAAGNCYHEPVTLVAATKTRTPEEICRAVKAGIGDVGENRVQEFTAKYDLITGARRHFIGRLQTNKVKYLIGRADLIHSLDRDDLAAALSKRGQEAGAVTDVLIEVNIGGEKSKGGYPPDSALTALERLSALPALRVRGFMAMLPPAGTLAPLCDEMRALFDEAKRNFPSVEYLSMGMSGDWELCVERGANMIRLGTAIFGERR